MFTDQQMLFDGLRRRFSQLLQMIFFEFFFCNVLD